MWLLVFLHVNHSLALLEIYTLAQEKTYEIIIMEVNTYPV